MIVVDALRQLKVTFSVYGNQGIKDNIKKPEADNTDDNEEGEDNQFDDSPTNIEEETEQVQVRRSTRLSKKP